MKKNLPYRCWYYFRQGWSTYFAFIFAAINTLTVTYFLAIEQYPTLKILFPSFFQYVMILSLIGIPTLVIIGYIHYKKLPAYKSEADVMIESNPHTRRMLINSETILGLFLQLFYMMPKLSKNEKLSEKEIKDIYKLQDNLAKYMKKRTTEPSKMETIFDTTSE